MDIRKRQEAPSEFTNILVETKLKMRAKAIQDILWSARNPSNKIKGYDLSNCYRKYKFKVKRCWECGSTTHLKAYCPVHRYNQLRFRVSELEEIIVELMEKLQLQQKNRKKRQLKKKKKL